MIFRYFYDFHFNFHFNFHFTFTSLSLNSLHLYLDIFGDFLVIFWYFSGENTKKSKSPTSAGFEPRFLFFEHGAVPTELQQRCAIYTASKTKIRRSCSQRKKIWVSSDPLSPPDCGPSVYAPCRLLLLFASEDRGYMRASLLEPH